jgi:hypothetical protein
LSNGQQCISQAETTLLRALDLENWQAPEPLSYIRDSREAFAAGRLDAEYFTPRVHGLLQQLAYDGLSISDVAPVRHEKFKIHEANRTFRYIEISDICSDGQIEFSILATKDAPSRATQYVHNGDILTSTVRPIRRLSALANAEHEGAVCSSGFVVLQPQRISGATLLTYLRLPPICELMNLYTSASLYPAISEKDLLAIPIPLIAANIQQEIDAGSNAARQAKQRAIHLLESAKRAVEIAIEDSETAALNFLRDAEE